jgi:hypothetical protein
MVVPSAKVAVYLFIVFSGCVVDASIMTRYRKPSSVIFNPDKSVGFYCFAALAFM